MARYGLIGERLGHSWSPRIHAHLGSAPYELIELARDEVAPFIAERSWDGLNVTIPYKKLAAEAADERSARVEALGAANTTRWRRNGRRRALAAPRSPTTERRTTCLRRSGGFRGS